MSVLVGKNDVTQIYKRSEKLEPNWGLVRQYLPLLKSIVGKMAINFPQNFDRESIYSIGLLGLISASQTYKASIQNAFGAYAGIRIKGALLDELRRIDWLPRSVRTKVKNFKKQVAQRERILGRCMSDEEICNYMHVTLHELVRIRQCTKPCVFVPLDLNHDNPNLECENILSLEEKLADISQVTGREVCEKNEMKTILRGFLDELPKHIQQIFTLHYNEGLCLSEIALVFNLSESRICQIHTETLAKLRRKLLTKINI